jgi:hypothetical protein
VRRRSAPASITADTSASSVSVPEAAGAAVGAGVAEATGCRSRAAGGAIVATIAVRPIRTATRTSIRRVGTAGV